MSCMDYKPVITSTGFLSVLATQVCASACSIVISLVATKKCINLYFHVNCKILLVTLLLLFIVHSIGTAVGQTHHLVRYTIYQNPCDAVTPAAFCFAWRLTQQVCLASFAMLQLGMVLERAIALWRREHYETSGSVLGIFIVGCSITAGAGLATWSLIQMNLQAKLVYCASTSETSYRSKIRSYILCGINLTALFCAGMLFFLNEAALRRKHVNLHSSYQLRENFNVISVIIPLSVVQSSCHLFLSVGGVVLFTYESSIPVLTFRVVSAATYIMPYYTLVTPLILLLLLKWSSTKRRNKLAAITVTPNEKDTYFTTYSKMWAIT